MRLEFQNSQVEIPLQINVLNELYLIPNLYVNSKVATTTLVSVQVRVEGAEL